MRPPNLTTYEKGQLATYRKMLPEWLEAHFGPLSEAVNMKLTELSLDEASKLWKNSLKATSLAELGLDG